MFAYLIRRLWQTIPTLFGVVLLVFFLFRRFGMDPVQTLASLDATPREIAEIRAQLGLGEPWWVQLGLFIKGIVTFDWGRSWATTTCAPRAPRASPNRRCCSATCCATR